MTIDPICGMEVDEGPDAITSVYNGRTYYFCCQACKEQFDRDPARYVQ